MLASVAIDADEAGRQVIHFDGVEKRGDETYLVKRLESGYEVLSDVPYDLEPPLTMVVTGRKVLKFDVRKSKET